MLSSRRRSKLSCSQVVGALKLVATLVRRSKYSRSLTRAINSCNRCCCCWVVVVDVKCQFPPNLNKRSSAESFCSLGLVLAVVVVVVVVVLVVIVVVISSFVSPSLCPIFRHA